MRGLQDNSPLSAVSSYRPRFMILVVISACILFTLVVSAGSANLSSGASAAFRPSALCVQSRFARVKSALISEAC